MKIFRFLVATWFFVAGGCLCFLNVTTARAFAYGPGTQDEVYPQRLQVAAMGDLARQKIESKLKENGETRRYELKLIRAPLSAMPIPAGKVICEVELPKPLNYGSSNPVHINVFVDGKFYRKAVCYYKLSVFDKILVATHDIQLESPITMADAKLEEREVTGASNNYFVSLDKIGNLVAGRVIRANTPIMATMLRSPAVMDVGTPITLITTYNGVQVRAEGVAMQKGRIGAMIRVKNARSGKMLRGRVIDASTVAI